MTALQIRLRTLTPLWTGGIDQTCDRLHETGLIGSLRWWYEALVRGLGAYACDPTGDSRCTYDENEGVKSLCAACHLFGATGWARKFRLRVLDAEGKLLTQSLQAGTVFVLKFLEMRPLAPEEHWLLARSVKVASDYGSLGGKTTLKPQDKPRVGDDYGLVEWLGGATVALTVDKIKAYLGQFKTGSNSEFPSLDTFFFVQGGHLERDGINKLLGQEHGGAPLPDSKQFQEALRGRRGTSRTDAVSKKIFSFRSGGEDGRMWGYAPDASKRDETVKAIQDTLPKVIVKTGEEVLNEL